MLCAESANAGNLCLSWTPFDRRTWFDWSIIKCNKYAGVCFIDNSAEIWTVVFWLFELYEGNWRKHLNKLICICSSYHSGFPPEAPSERGGNMVRPYTLMKIAAKALILWTIATWQMWWSLQNFFSSEGETKTEQEMSRPHHPTKLWNEVEIVKQHKHKHSEPTDILPDCFDLFMY